MKIDILIDHISRKNTSKIYFKIIITTFLNDFFISILEILPQFTNIVITIT